MKNENQLSNALEISKNYFARINAQIIQFKYLEHHSMIIMFQAIDYYVALKIGYAKKERRLNT